MNMFQFLYGAIGRKDLAPLLFSDFLCFNSYMVRLEVAKSISKRSFIRVSIPIWCDWKPVIGELENGYLMFQFLYGAIGSFEVALYFLLKLGFNSYMVRLEATGRIKHGGNPVSFNSYMVRLEVGRLRSLDTSNTVSIPIWCDWKAEAKAKEEAEALFQFLYGAIGRGGVLE